MRGVSYPAENGNAILDLTLQRDFQLMGHRGQVRPPLQRGPRLKEKSELKTSEPRTAARELMRV